MRRTVALATVAILLLLFSLPAGAEEAGFSLGRFLTCRKVVNLEPVEPTDSFDEDTQKVYAFIEALDIINDTDIKVQWLFEGKETALIEMTLRKGQRWRTYSSKRIGTRQGKWEVRLLDGQDNLMRSLTFTVQQPS